MEFVQVTLTTAQTDLLTNVLRSFLQGNQPPEDLATALADLGNFFENVTDNPRAYVPTGKMARSIKIRKRRMRTYAAGV